MMEGQYEWEGGEDDRADLQAKAVEFAKNYLIFDLDPRGRAIFEHWTTVYARKRTPVNASIGEYAANEAMRAFIENIREQINYARREGNI